MIKNICLIVLVLFILLSVLSCSKKLNRELATKIITEENIYPKDIRYTIYTDHVVFDSRYNKIFARTIAGGRTGHTRSGFNIEIYNVLDSTGVIEMVKMGNINKTLTAYIIYITKKGKRFMLGKHRPLGEPFENVRLKACELIFKEITSITFSKGKNPTATAECMCYYGNYSPFVTSSETLKKEFVGKSRTDIVRFKFYKGEGWQIVYR